MPVLVGIYPLALVLIILAFLHPFIGHLRLAYPVTMLFTGVAAVTAGIGQAGFKNLWLILVLRLLASQGLDWVVPSVAGLVVGVLLKP